MSLTRTDLEDDEGSSWERHGKCHDARVSVWLCLGEGGGRGCCTDRLSGCGGGGLDEVMRLDWWGWDRVGERTFDVVFWNRGVAMGLI